MAEGIDRAADERMEFTTSKDVTVAPTFAAMHLKGNSSPTRIFNHMCDVWQKISSVASMHTVTSPLQPSNLELLSKYAKAVIQSPRRNQVPERQQPSRSVCFRSSIQPFARHKLWCFPRLENSRPRFNQL